MARVHDGAQFYMPPSHASTDGTRRHALIFPQA